MIYLWKLLYRHFTRSLDKKAALWTLFLSAVLIVLNYKLDYEKYFLHPNQNNFPGWITFWIYYMLIYLLVLIPVLHFQAQLYKLKKAEFWIKISVFLGIIACQRNFDLYKMDNHAIDYYLNQYYNSLMLHVELFLFLFPALFLLWLIYDRRQDVLYGLRFRDSYALKFFTLIIFVIPLVVWASSRPEFLEMYPRFKFWLYPHFEGISKFWMTAFWELLYGLDFFSTEWLYRGALVIGLSSLLGKESLWPMVAVYVAIHFGKPSAECISSFLGGYILGVFALQLKSIWGGVIIHLLLAWLMELGAALYYFFH
ncbi:MAG: hypothetical protein D6813_12025 [Calditrichaeota bacterium]|nr:MAG: hypothetical protein D6813_12025 [Calditrichota bacterium]